MMVPKLLGGESKSGPKKYPAKQTIGASAALSKSVTQFVTQFLKAYICCCSIVFVISDFFPFLLLFDGVDVNDALEKKNQLFHRCQKMTTALL